MARKDISPIDRIHSDPLYSKLAKAVSSRYTRLGMTLFIFPAMIPTVNLCRLDDVVIPLYNATQGKDKKVIAALVSTDMPVGEGTYTFEQIDKAIELLHPNYRFIASVPAVLNITAIVKAEEGGKLGVAKKAADIMDELNSGAYNLSNEYYAAVEATMKELLVNSPVLRPASSVTGTTK